VRAAATLLIKTATKKPVAGLASVHSETKMLSFSGRAYILPVGAPLETPLCIQRGAGSMDVGTFQISNARIYPAKRHVRNAKNGEFHFLVCRLSSQLLYVLMSTRRQRKTPQTRYTTSHGLVSLRNGYRGYCCHRLLLLRPRRHRRCSCCCRHRR